MKRAYKKRTYRDGITDYTEPFWDKMFKEILEYHT